VVDREGGLVAVRGELPLGVHGAGVVDEHVDPVEPVGELGSQGAGRLQRLEVGDEGRHVGRRYVDSGPRLRESGESSPTGSSRRAAVVGSERPADARRADDIRSATPAQSSSPVSTIVC
jgi:hypothetical protein